MLHDISLEVRRAEIVALVGSNGAGKTTLLRALSRILPSTGNIVMNGHPLSRATPDQAFACGMVQVPEGRQLFDRMTVQDNLLMGPTGAPPRPTSRATWTRSTACFRVCRTGAGSLPAACPAASSRCAPWPAR